MKKLVEIRIYAAGEYGSHDAEFYSFLPAESGHNCEFIKAALAMALTDPELTVSQIETIKLIWKDDGKERRKIPLSVLV